jgi:hypothetical protein
MITKPCPQGGYCIDPGNPSDCELNACLFKSLQEKAEFDALPDKYILELGNQVLKFKNKSQVKFLLNDYPEWENAIVHQVIQIEELFKE